jgi:hypothetical protein
VSCPTCTEAERSSYKENKDKAKSAYQSFLTLWKDADPAIPVLKQAGEEYGKL